MCMKYVNVNVQCFAAQSLGFLGGAGLSSLIRTVPSTKKGEKYEVGRFTIATFVNIRGTGKGDNVDNPLDAGEKLDFKVRLTKISTDETKRLSYDLHEFSVDLLDADSSKIQEACFKYFETIQVTDVNGLELNEPGEYVIKILVKKANAERYDIQIVHPITVEE